MVATALIPSLVALLLSAGFLLAQAAKAPAGPEHRRLAYFAGTWSFRLEMKPSPFGPGGTVTDTNELLPGGFFLLRRYETKSPVGEFKGLEVIGYNVETKEYLQHGFDNLGQSHLYRGSVTGDTWTWTFEAAAEGRTYKVRVTLKEVSSDRQAYRADISSDGVTWTNILEGTLEKMK